jgi:hypothetical protein
MVDREAKKEELQKEAKELREKKQAQQDALIDEVKSDDDIGNIESTYIGSVEIRHKGWIPGDEMKNQAKDIAQQGGSEQLEEMIYLLTQLTEKIIPEDSGSLQEDSEFYVFWEDFLDNYGTDGLSVLIDRIIGPIIEETQEKTEAMESFQGKRQSPETGHGLERNIPNPE